MAKAVVPVAAPPPAEKPAQQWELAAQWRQGLRVVKFAATAFVVIAFLVVVGQGYLFYRLFDDLHPVAGYAYIAVLTLALIWVVARPVAAFLSVPAAARPPDILIDPKAPEPDAIAARLRYDVRYLQMLAANPEVQAERAAIDAGIAKGRKLAAKAARTDLKDVHGLSAELETFEREHVEALLAPLDKKVNQIIHSEAVGVGVATALSMNGTVDAFIVLWRNANLIARISKIYFGRPHLTGSLRILRDVAAIVVAARALEDVTDITGDLIGSLLGRMGGLIAGPVMDGGINAMMTLKLGYLAKRRCRSFKGWTAVQASAISEEALEDVKKESGSVISDLLKRTGGLTAQAARAAEMAMSSSQGAWVLIRSWFGGGRPQGAT